MKDIVLRKLNEAISVVKQDSSFLTTSDQEILESKLKAVRDAVAETYSVRMNALPCGG